MASQLYEDLYAINRSSKLVDAMRLKTSVINMQNRIEVSRRAGATGRLAR